MPIVRLRHKSYSSNRAMTTLGAAMNDDLSKEDEAAVLIQGEIFKRGSKETDEFLPRWVVVKPTCVTYAKFRNTKVIDYIDINELLGIASRGIDSRDDDLKGNATSADFSDLDASRISTRTQDGLRRNAVFWRFKLEYKAEKKRAFKYELDATAFALFTSPLGFHRGRVFVFKCETFEAREKWTETIGRLLSARLEKPLKKTSAFFNLRKRVRWFYSGDTAQIFVAVLIMGNFLLNICQAQVGDHSELASMVFEQIDLGFTCIFTVELAVNMFATLCMEFVQDAWNWFDFIVVAVSLISLVLTDLPGADVLRLLRCFRVFRLFKRIASLRKIMGALTQSVLPMLNAFAIVCLVTAIYAIVGVTFFAKIEPDLFASFFLSFFSLFQSITGDNWSEDCRNLMVESGQGAMVGIFYVSFMLIVSLVLVNVVIAVLLDAFSKAASSEPLPILLDSTNEDDIIKHKCPFERIARNLCSSADVRNLELEIDHLWEQIVTKGQINMFAVAEHDLDKAQFDLLKATLRAWRFGDFKNWTISIEEFRRGFKSLPYVPPIIISFRQYAEHARPFCHSRDILGRKGFQGLMKTVVRKYQMRELARAKQEDAWNQTSMHACLIGTMGLLREDMEISASGRAAKNFLRRDRKKPDQLLPPHDNANRMILTILEEGKKLESRFHQLETLCSIRGENILQEVLDQKEL